MEGNWFDVNEKLRERREKCFSSVLWVGIQEPRRFGSWMSLWCRQMDGWQYVLRLCLMSIWLFICNAVVSVHTYWISHVCVACDDFANMPTMVAMWWEVAEGEQIMSGCVITRQRLEIMEPDMDIAWLKIKSMANFTHYELIKEIFNAFSTYMIIIYENIIDGNQFDCHFHVYLHRFYLFICIQCNQISLLCLWVYTWNMCVVCGVRNFCFTEIIKCGRKWWI